MSKDEISKQIQDAILQQENAGSKHVLITGGPTCEDIDSVRFLSNRSTGTMGYEAAVAAAEMGYAPILILGPTLLEFDSEYQFPIIKIRSAAEMLFAVQEAFDWCDILVMSAAVADYTPIKKSQTKIKKGDGELIIKLQRTEDILKSISGHEARKSKLIAGFSLDNEINIEEGMRKLTSKNLDLIVVNGVKAFAADNSSVRLITKSGKDVELISSTKRDIAKRIFQLLEQEVL